MSAPGWVAGVLAALMVAVSLTCAARLVIGWLRHRPVEPDADGLHVLMGIAMAGMLEPRLSPIPGTAWLGVFAAAATWFAWHATRARDGGRRDARRCSPPLAHAIESAAMAYMLLPTDSALAGRPAGMAMPAMSGGTASGATAAIGGNPAIALVLIVFMLGYLVWTTDQLATLSRAPSGGLAHGRAAGNAEASSGVALAPRLAVCSKITMTIAMGYMLVTML